MGPQILQDIQLHRREHVDWLHHCLLGNCSASDLKAQLSCTIPRTLWDGCMQNNHRTTTLSPSSKKQMVLRTLCASWAVTISWVTVINHQTEENMVGLHGHLFSYAKCFAMMYPNEHAPGLCLITLD